MMHPHHGIGPLLASLLVLVGCRHADPHDAEILLLPPPVVPSVALLSDTGEAQDHEDHDHPAATSAPSQTTPVVVRAVLSHQAYTRSLPARLILRVDVTTRADAPPSRRPLNLALVIDRSDSMAEDEKFMHAMMAAQLVVENLADRDVISLIAFNETATVLSPAGRSVNAKFLRYRLGQLGPMGYTNLSAGLLEAFAQIDSAAADGQHRQIILLTDGMANRGITDRQELRDLVGSARARGIGLSTLGCGAQFDETCLTQLAEAGGGRYTFVRSSELIPTAITTELNGLLSVVAQNAKLEIRVAPPGRITRVYERLIDEPTSSHTVELGDIRDGEQGVFLLEIGPGDFEDGATVGVDTTLTMDNPKTAIRRRLALHSEAAYAENAQRVRRTENEGVVMYAAVLQAMERAEEALQGLDIKQFRQARGMFDRLYEDARKYAIDVRDQQLLNQTFLLRHFMAELVAASESGIMHDHGEARRRFKKDADYRRYLLKHHRRR